MNTEIYLKRSVMFARLAKLVPVLTLACLAGCNTKVKYEKTDSLDPFESRVYSVEGPAKDQKVKVEITSTESEITYWVVLDKDKPKDLETLDASTKIPNALSTGSNKKAETVEVTIPGKQPFSVIIAGAKKKTTITVKING
jgi:hypothetical protein